MIISQSINLILTSYCIHRINVLKLLIVKRVIELLKIILPSLFLGSEERWAFEIQVIPAIYFSKLVYIVHVIISLLAGILYKMSIGFGMAAQIPEEI